MLKMDERLVFHHHLKSILSTSVLSLQLGLLYRLKKKRLFCRISELTKNRPCGRAKRRRPIFPWGCPQSIVRAEELNFRVRDGNGCTLFAIAPVHLHIQAVSLDTVYSIIVRKACQYFFHEFSYYLSPATGVSSSFK